MRILPYLVLSCYALAVSCLGYIVYIPSPSLSGAELPSLRLIVVTPAHEEATSLIAPFGPGYDRELLAEFCKNYDCDILWTKAADKATALDQVRQGKADLAMGFTGSGEGIRNRGGLTTGPVYYHSREVAVSTKGPVLAPGSVTGGPASVAGPVIGGTGVSVPSNASVQEMAELERQFFLNERAWSLWEPFAPLASDVSTTAGVRENYHWFWNTRHASLNYGLTLFWTKRQGPDDTLLRRLDERYYGYLPESINPYAVQDLMSILKNRLPRYSGTIAKASSKVDIDPLLFTSVIIQESRLDEGTVSHTGVRGIMQLTQRTAQYLGVDRMDPTAAIGAGARYLNMLWKNLEGLDLDPWDRWFFALAAFNQGPRRLEGAMELSRLLGGTGRTWEELKEIFPLLAQKEYASMVGQGVCRGQEAVDFVERVRFSYHILRGLVALDRPEGKNLAPLVRGFGREALGL